MYDMKISDSIVYVGVDDKDIDLFESQYKVPNGVTYNSYVILDEKIAVMDTVDKRRTQQWLDNLEKVLDGRKPKKTGLSGGISSGTGPCFQYPASGREISGYAGGFQCEGIFHAAPVFYA